MQTLAKRAMMVAAFLVLPALIPDTGGSPALAAATLTDSQILNAVDDELIQDSAVPADKIVVTAIDGIVTLSGSVNNILARDRAIAVTKTVKGVRGVVDKLDVAVSFRSDAVIEEDIKDALFWDPVTESWNISVSSDNGLVTLEGKVDSWQQKQLVSRIAKGIKGVTGIRNDLVIDHKSSRSDFEIREEIKKALRWDALVDDALIDVSVEDGKAILTGTVGSAAEKTRAESIAWVANVRSVDTEGLRVEWWSRDQRLRKGKYGEMSDAEVKAAIVDAMLYDPRVISTHVDVTVDNGSVTLRGTVDDLKEKRVAASDARNVVGVWTVNNLIKVVPKTGPSDDRIEEKVENALIRDPYVDRYDIAVSVVGGEVYLSGDVDTRFEKAQADDIASRQRGVLKVHNFLSVHSMDIEAYDPYTDEWYPYDYNWYAGSGSRATSGRSDWEIEQDIEGELFWSPFVDADEVTVDVENGIAILSGRVDSWREREAAEENALEGGALAVRNNLTVTFGPDTYKP